VADLGEDRAAVGPRWGGGWPPWFVLPIIAAVQVIGTFGASRDQEVARDVDVLAVALVLTGPIILWFTRRRPVLGAALLMALTFAYFARGYPGGPVVISPVVGLIRAVLSGHRRATWVIAAVGVAALLASHQLAGEYSDEGWISIIAVATWAVIVLVVADIARSRFARRESARRARVEQQRRQASEERLRIAQELHDVLAHNISMINVQAGVGLHLMDTHPEQAREALAAIKQASKDTLGELRSVLDLLRGTDAAPRMPTGGLHDLEALVARVRSADLDVRVDRTGDTREVPPEVDLAAFRIVQEALTNVVRHASSARTVRVWLDYRDDSLAVHVDDDGRTPSPTTGDDAGSGNGLPGMRERATALGGSFRAGPRPGGGFAVHAVLPTGPSDAPRSGPPHAEPSSTVADAAATGSQP
jgi:signal transduction histidine kinase